jgi:hypothetical protein
LKGLVQNKNPSPKILRNSSTEIPSCAGWHNPIKG